MFPLLLAVAVLLIGAVVLSLVYEGVAGNESFSLPFANIFLVVVAGSILFWFFGWPAVAVVIGLYAVWAIAGGLIERLA